MNDRIALFVTCLGDLLEPQTIAAAVDVLRAVGCEVTVPDGQTCCGQPAWNSGFAEQAARVASASLDALDADPTATVVVPAGSCATMIRLYWPELFRVVGDDARAVRAERLGERVRELSEELATRALPPLECSEPCTVVYHRSCHMERELHLHDQPTDVLAQVGGCRVAAWDADDRCCGFGGTFSVKLPETSIAMADEKLDAMPAGVETIVGSDSSCLMHLRTRAEQRGLAVRTRHLAQVLAEALAADE
jgi:L-lactate dehydrogenase complex protein LldE